MAVGAYTEGSPDGQLCGSPRQSKSEIDSHEQLVRNDPFDELDTLRCARHKGKDSFENPKPCACVQYCDGTVRKSRLPMMGPMPIPNRQKRNVRSTSYL